MPRLRHPNRRATLRHLGAAVALGVIALATYRNSFDASFTLDSVVLVRDAGRVHDATLANVRQILSDDYWSFGWVSGAYRPLTTLSYLLNYAVLGNADRPAGYHWVNLGLHWANALLVYGLALSIIGRSSWAFVAAALFATHPVATEAVTNIVGRADLLATLAVLGALLLYIRGQSRLGRRRLPWLVGCSLTALLGLFCKETALVLPGIVVLYDVTFRLEGDDRGWGHRVWRLAVTGWVYLIPPLLLFWGARRLVYRGATPAPVYFAENPLVATDFWTARLTAVKVIGKYLWLLLWPQDLSWDYSVNQVKLFRWALHGWEDWQAVVALVAVATIAFAAISLFRRSKALFFYLGLFAVALVPTSNLIVLIPAIMGERFLYLPSIGFTACVALAARAVTARLGRRAAVFIPVGLSLLIVAYGLRAYSRNFDWRDELTLCTAAVQVTPDSFRAHKCLAAALYAADAQQNINRVITEAETAQAILDHSTPPSTPVTSAVLEDLGLYYRVKAARLSGTDAAVPTPESLAWSAKSATALERADAWWRWRNAEHRRTEVRRGKPPDDIVDLGSVSLALSLASTYTQLGRPEKARDALRWAQHLNPGAANVYIALGAAEVSAGSAEDAILTFMQAFMVDRTRQEVWPHLRVLYQQIDPDSCAFTLSNGQYRFNDACPIARRHICEAHRRLVDIFRGANQRAAAERVRDNALRNYGCTEPPLTTGAHG